MREGPFWASHWLLPMQEMQETQVQSLGWEDALEKEMAPHSSILAWKIPWTEEPGGLQPMGSQRVRHDSAHTHTEGPFQSLSPGSSGLSQKWESWCGQRTLTPDLFQIPSILFLLNPFLTKSSPTMDIILNNDLGPSKIYILGESRGGEREEGRESKKFIIKGCLLKHHKVVPEVT